MGKRAAVLEGAVRDLTRGGEGVVVTPAGAVLVPGALPGERVRLKLEGRRRGAERGRLLEVLDPSPDRVEPVCPLQRRCGGCAWMPLAVDAQRALKRARIERALESAGAGGPEVELLVGASAEGYRTRARLAWERSTSGLRVGYRAAATRRVIDVDRCAVLTPLAADALARVRARLHAELEGRGEIELSPGAAGGTMVRLHAEAPQPQALYRAAEALTAEVSVDGVELAVADLAPAHWGEVGQAHAAGDARLTAGVGAFAQANAELNARLIERVVALAEPGGVRVLELYAGYGNLTAALAREAAELTAVEGDPAAAAACRDNLARLGVRARVVAGPAARHAEGRPVDVVVLDPPRTGARDALPGVLGRRPRRIVYVSCDAATLARDLATLRGGGYHPDAAAALDMFPHTGHVEAIVRLSPGAGAAQSTPGTARSG